MEKIDQILESLYDRVIEPVEAKEQLLLLFGVIKSLPLQDLIEFCERQLDFYDEEGYSEDAKKFHNAAYTFTKFWAEKTYGNVL